MKSDGAIKVNASGPSGFGFKPAASTMLNATPNQ